MCFSSVLFVVVDSSRWSKESEGRAIEWIIFPQRLGKEKGLMGWTHDLFGYEKDCLFKLVEFFRRFSCRNVGQTENRSIIQALRFLDVERRIIR